MALVQLPLVCGLMLLIYCNFNRTSQAFLNGLFLPATSSQTVTYGLVASPCLTPVVKFISCSFGHLTCTCNTPLFYRCTVESILTGSSAADRTLSVHKLITLPVGHCHSVLFNAPYVHCHTELFSVPYDNSLCSAQCS